LGVLSSEDSKRKKESQERAQPAETDSRHAARDSRPRRASAGSEPSLPPGNSIAARKPDPVKLKTEHGQLRSLLKAATGGSSEGKNRILLKVKQKSIDSEIEDVRRQREDLERRYEKGRISREEYETELEELIKRGQSLLIRKTEVCRELEIVAPK